MEKGMGRSGERLTLDRQMALEPLFGFRVVEDLLERRILERCAVDVSCDPAAATRVSG